MPGKTVFVGIGLLLSCRYVMGAHTDNAWMKQIQQGYPNPPLVVFLSNNEHSKLIWTEVETDARYLAKYGHNRDADFKRKAVADGWIERYRSLQHGMRDGLEQMAWTEHSIYIGYDAFGPPRHRSRWSIAAYRKRTHTITRSVLSR